MGEVSGTPSAVNYTYDGDKLTRYKYNNISYNSIGYPIKCGDRTFVWTDGKLTRMCDDIEDLSDSSAEDICFGYNGYGQRISKTYSYDPGDDYSGNFTIGKNTSYTYDESGRLIREQSIEYFSESASVTRELIYLYDESGVIGVAYSRDGGSYTPYYYRRNAFGDVISIYDATGNRKAEYAYDAWGNCKLVYEATGSEIGWINPIRYRGYYYDEDTGLYYLNARYYNPEWRRFISPDGTDFIDPETPNGLNLYAYCYNDPVNYCDPSGHMAFWLAAGLVVAGLGLVGGATYAGISSYNAGNTGWNLVGDIALDGLIGGVAGFAFGALGGAGAAALFAGNFMAETAAVFAGVTYAFKMLSAGGITATVFMLGDNVFNSVHYSTHVFWSGGEATMNAASYLSKYVNGISLEMTLLGRYLTYNNIRLDDAWMIASQNFANQVSIGGTVFSIQNIGGIGIDSFWALYEYPILLKKNVHILFEFIGGI